MFKVFVRNWYKLDTDTNQLVPDPTARKHYLYEVADEETARWHCREYNLTHEPGPLSRKAEYTET